eukprot:TRINITY_DN9123_c0_g1_i1.p1 TRINITY_DN9123_c0_g1~~TRINITY_DN9123_c0_g1_i1.p1  ORF type:complete len:348 (+),score=112.76 TRINITY_DN9123_c0_g1_i1:307-1350(+)
MSRRHEVVEMEDLAEGFHRLSTAVVAFLGVGSVYIAFCLASGWVEVAFDMACAAGVLGVVVQGARWLASRRRYTSAKASHDVWISSRDTPAAQNGRTPSSASLPPMSPVTASADENKYILKATQLREKKMYTKSRALLEEAVQRYPTCLKLLSLLCELCNDEASSVRSNDPLQEIALRTGMSAATKLTERHGQSCEGFKWSAVFLARLTPYKPYSEKLSDAVVVRKHSRDAIRHNPTDPLSNHVMGAWLYSMGSLNWYQKSAAQTLTGDPLEATVEEALEYLHKAHDHSNGGFMENSSLIGDCYRHKGNTEEADKWYATSLTQNKGPKDIKSQAEKIKKKMTNPPPW